MSYFDQREDSILLMDESLLNLYDEQFEYSSFKSLISKSSSFANGWSLFAYLLCLELIASRYRTFFGDKTAISIN
ncbi:hypothetical protein ACTQXK_00005, partial [Catenibacterium mitsuokai]|uniref:hypothetical protein n=1 Tax=Catenibacterium mitsuokai TaxID=100886 RepID=UPI003F8ED1E9